MRLWCVNSHMVNIKSQVLIYHLHSIFWADTVETTIIPAVDKKGFDPVSHPQAKWIRWDAKVDCGTCLPEASSLMTSSMAELGMPWETSARFLGYTRPCLQGQMTWR